MPTYEITAPDGKVLEITAPEGATQEQVLAYAQANYKPQAAQQPVPQPAERFDPAEGMGAAERFAAGFGRSFVEAGRGLKQAATESAQRSARIAAVGLDRVGLEGVGRAVAGSIGAPLDASAQRQQANIDEMRRLERPLMDTGMGQAGNFTGNLAMIAAPAGALRATALRSAALPTTIRGNVAQGALLGALQPTATGESRVGGAATGAALGGIGAGVLKAAGAGLGALGRLATRKISSADEAAGQILRNEAENPLAILSRQESSVPGVNRTLAEQTLDPGIARLERTLRSSERGFDAIDRSNNAARIAAINSFAGDGAALAAARSARTQQTESALNQAMQDRGVDLAPVRSLLEANIQRTATRPPVQSALNDVRASLDQAGDDVFSLYGTRKYIDDLLSGKAGADKSYAKAATRELMEIKGALDKQLADASPSFADYLSRYRELSVPINRMQLGQALTSAKSGSAILDPVTGAQVLTPAQFSKASRSLDEIAAKATGFKKAKAEQILQPSDVAVIKAIQDDMERQAFRATAGSGGNSQTFERGAIDQRMARAAASDLVGGLPGGKYIAGFMESLDKAKNDRVKERLAYLVANPDEAERVIRALPGPSREIVRKALTQIGGSTGAAAGVTAGAAQPLEIDIVGGRAVPLEQFDRDVRP